MSNVSKHEIIDLLNHLKYVVSSEVPNLEGKEFDEAIALFHEVYDEIKDIVFDKRNKGARQDFEEGWGAQSIQFVIDCIPEIHRIMKAHYKRSDELSFLDVGAGSGAGSNIFTMLHSGRHVYSKLNVDAIDYTDSRLRWVKTMYPKVNYSVSDIYDLPSNNWDLVFCSHVIEHVPTPRKFLEKLVDICKGYLFVYSPYNEIDRIPAHINTITESLYEGFNVENMNIMKSMSWHADIENDMCLLAVIDCKKS